MRLSDLMQHPRPSWSDPCQCACGCGRHHMHTVLRGGLWFHSMECMERAANNQVENNEMAQTPGPWTVSKTEPHVVIDGNGLVVAQGLMGDQEDRDNACLVAAAPDLLAALKAVVRYWSPCDGTGGTNEARLASALADAAISKAEGAS